MLEKIHKQIRESCPSEEAHDFIIHTDGSGYVDGYGGSASYMVSKRYNRKETRVLSSSHTTVDRAEFEALLLGLQSIIDSMGWVNRGDINRLKDSPNKPTVMWFADRESLILSVWRDSDGRTICKRKKQADLWARFEFYEQLFDITPILIPRNSNSEHRFVDKLASESRMLVKEYYEVLQLDKNE